MPMHATTHVTHFHTVVRNANDRVQSIVTRAFVKSTVLPQQQQQPTHPARRLARQPIGGHGWIRRNCGGWAGGSCAAPVGKAERTARRHACRLHSPNRTTYASETMPQ